MPLANEIKNDFPQPGEVSIWWIGQSGYIIKTPGQTVIAVDPYLTDSLSKDRNTPLKRLLPPCLSPESLAADLLLLTHSHQDHADPETLKVVPKDFTVGGPGSVQKILDDADIAPENRVMFWPGREFVFKDVTIMAGYAQPTDETDLTHVGYHLFIKNGPRLFFTGDTANHPLIYCNRAFKPDVAFVCINGGYNNLSFWHAAQYCAELRVKTAVPCHYGMFTENTCDPDLFAFALKQLAPDIFCKALPYGGIWRYGARTLF